MRIRTAAVLVALAIAAAGPASACGADKTTKVDTKQQTATQTLKQDTAKKKGG
jgi:hypothetical protein